MEVGCRGDVEGWDCLSKTLC